MEPTEHNQWIDWAVLDGHRFQDLCLDLLSSEGYQVQEQGVGPDGGVDAILIQTINLPDGSGKNIRWAAQFKFRKDANGTVKPHELGNILNVLLRFKADGFFLITNGRVTNKLLAELRATSESGHPTYFLSVWTRRHLEQRLRQKSEVANRYLKDVPLPLDSTAILQITIDLPVRDFSYREQRLLKHALASFLDIPSSSITIEDIEEGSTKIILRLPSVFARHLQDAFDGEYLDLEPLGFTHPILQMKLNEGNRPVARSTLTLPRVPPSRFHISYFYDAQQETSEQLRLHLENLDHSGYGLLKLIASRHLRYSQIAKQYEPSALVADTVARLLKPKSTFVRSVRTPREDLLTKDEFYYLMSRHIRNTLLMERRHYGPTLKGRENASSHIILEPSTVTVPNETLLLVHQALDRLRSEDPNSAKVVELRFFVGLSVGETATLMNVSEARARRLLRQAFVRLRQLLEE